MHSTIFQKLTDSAATVGTAIAAIWHWPSAATIFMTGYWGLRLYETQTMQRILHPKRFQKPGA